MKKLQLTFLALCISAMSFAQVGIGTNTPTAGSILELKAADKALLLTRVANTAAVTTPVNGMMVYDISSNCIKGYQNGAWTDCLSACGSSSSTGGGGGDFGFDFTSTFIMIDASTAVTAGINPDGKVFIWGRNYNYKFFPDNLNTEVTDQLMTPAYAPLPGTETAQKVVVGDQSVMVLTNSGKVYVMGVNETYNQQYGPALNGKIQQWVRLTATTDSTFVDIDASSTSNDSYMVGTSGKFYHAGAGTRQNYFYDAHITGYVVMNKPAGVPTNFMYTKVWGDTKGGGFKVYVKGSDNKIYAWGTEHSFPISTMGMGNSATAYGMAANMTPGLVQFPTPYPNIVKISHDFYHALALTDDGKAYGWGEWSYPSGYGKQYAFAATPLAANLVVDASNIEVITRPTLLNKPNDGSAGFTDVLVIENGSIVRTNTGAYFKGIDKYGIMAEPITGVYTNAEHVLNQGYIESIDRLDKTNYNHFAPTLSKFKTIFSAYWGKLFSINDTYKGYFIGGNYFGTGGLGIGTGGGFISTEYYSRPTPIATGIGDDTNPNPLY